MSSPSLKIPVWDPFVRVFHWSLVLAYAGTWITAEVDLPWHEKLGYFVLALLGLRLFWGLIGSRHARFSDFLRGPRVTMAYLKSLIADQPRDYLGHNPAGGWMIVLLIGSLALTIASGVLMGGAGEGVWEELHEGAAGLTLFLVVLHLVGVAASSLLHRENLILAMLTGRKLRRSHDV
jgi:cytochrome b